MRIVLLTCVLLSTVLAGCADGKATTDDEVDDEVFQEFVTDPTSGLIRGIVVDPSVVPIADVKVTVQGQDRSVTTNAAGAFAFDKLEAGTYFLSFSKAGYFPTQTSAQVDPAEAEPALVRVSLQHDASSLPFVEYHQFSGFLGCFVSTTVVRSPCDAVGAGLGFDDTNTQVMETQGWPTFVQGETVWDSTQPTGDGLYFSMWDGSTFSPIEAEGSSPLIIQANRDRLENGTDTWKPGNTAMKEPAEEVAWRVYAGGNELTKPPVCPEEAQDTIGQHVVTAKCWGNGVSIDQSFDIFTSVFYRVSPPEDYRFVTDGPFPVPDQ